MFSHCQMSSLSLKNPEYNLHFAVWRHLSLSGGGCTWMRKWSPQSHLTGHPPKGGHMLPVFAPGKILFCRYKMKMEIFFLCEPSTSETSDAAGSSHPHTSWAWETEAGRCRVQIHHSLFIRSWEFLTVSLWGLPLQTRSDFSSSSHEVKEQIIQRAESWCLRGLLHPGFCFCKAIPGLHWTLGVHHVLCPPNHPTQGSWWSFLWFFLGSDPHS